jgi:hypothetical protein
MIDDLDPRYDQLRDLGYGDAQMARLSSPSADEIIYGGIPPEYWVCWEDDNDLIAELAASCPVAPRSSKNGPTPEAIIELSPAPPTQPAEILPPPLRPDQDTPQREQLPVDHAEDQASPDADRAEAEFPDDVHNLPITNLAAAVIAAVW